MYLYGPAGCGKTCAALALLDHTVGKGLYYTVASLLAEYIQSQQGRLDWYREGRGGIIWPEQWWAQIYDAALVVLDELGCREHVSDAHYECVKRVIDERLGRPLILISNHDLQTIARIYDDRVFSRIASGTVFHLNGEDRRLS